MRTIGLVDYGIGNHASVGQCLRKLGYRVRLSAQPALLDEADVLVLPGVGAFKPAMQALHERGLVSYLRAQARAHRPIIGICLGMQLLATSSEERGHTPGLDLIPGQIHQMPDERWHIGWNAVECVGGDPLLLPSHNRYFYFNHSYVYHGPASSTVAVSRLSTPLASVIRQGNVVGLQFHPEKSQAAGQALLTNVIEGLAHA